MHPNPIYRQETAARNLAFAGARGFGMLTIAGPEGPLVSHVPFTLGDGFAEMHLVRSNPIARALAAPVPAVLAVTGPDAYVSPDWYGMEDQVPTWNYVAVHLRGQLGLLPPEDLRGQLDRLAATFEGRIAGKKPWVADKMNPDALERLMRMIVPVRLEIASVDGTWKLGQNKPGPARKGAAHEMEAAGIGAEIADLAALMRAIEG